MNKNRIKILFYLYKNKPNRRNECPVRCRITFLKQRKQFSTGLFINPSLWDSKQQSAKPPPDSYRDEENDIINTQLSLIKNKIHQAFLMLQIKQQSFDVQDIYTTYKGDKLAREWCN